MKMIDRKLLVLKTLAAGVTQQAHLENLCFLRDDGIKINRVNVYKMLQWLVKNGYILKRKFHRLRANRGLNVYALNTLGVNEVCNQYNIDRELIRHSIPKMENLAHELQVTETFRILMKEAEAGLYKVAFLWDDRQMKRVVRSTSRKKVFYPDVAVGIVPNYKKENRTYYIEIDMGTKGRSYWVPKIVSWDHVALVLCMNPDRLNRLKEFIEHSARKEATGFATVVDFMKGGLKNTVWTWAKTRVKGSLDI